MMGAEKQELVEVVNFIRILNVSLSWACVQLVSYWEGPQGLIKPASQRQLPAARLHTAYAGSEFVENH